jgi:hypothetical protein
MHNLSSRNLHALRKKASMTGKITKNILIGASNFSTYLSLFVNNRKVRDKFLAMFQYYFDFTCV